MSTVIFILILLYTTSFCFYFMSIIKGVTRISPWSYRFILAGNIIQVFVFSFKMLSEQYFPIITFFDIFFFYSLLLILLTVITHSFFEWEWFEMVMTLIAMIMLMGALLIGETSPQLSDSFISNLLFIHIIFSIISYGAFSISAIFSLMYILQEYLIKRKIWHRFSKGLPSLESLDRNAYLSNLIGAPLLLLGLTFGSIWAGVLFGWKIFVDAKVLTSFFILLMYGLFIFNRQKRRWMMKQLAIWNLMSFVMLIINFTISNLFVSFHRWF
ncbi:cytochrome c biogenesis protein CcsA [Tepidibacillus sp. HK-1]|uniref:cytochrome c biogenesis protein CcsA n=1 Tax=Tepidibacillus sp. HK-1 TaxID=1883407 RepID=UPI000852DDA6|nr:cytochrome c biogenesis protein CcsA [Tepidibacillus sp. HK-1]GBF10841.1 cytochrome c biogenesis protein CcsA [Tepidibacillus sp. HK-1]